MFTSTSKSAGTSVGDHRGGSDVGQRKGRVQRQGGCHSGMAVGQRYATELGNLSSHELVGDQQHEISGQRRRTLLVRTKNRLCARRSHPYNLIACILGVARRLHIWPLSIKNEGGPWTEKWPVSHTEEITCFVITYDSLQIITGSKDMSLKVWQINGGKLSQVRTHNTVHRRTGGARRSPAASLKSL